ncbi:hypothetical protein AALP_AAs63207U000100 [Arabis alpina]|uniref:Uncharacterized protein n=1 Tax=Arabis alpina TaxID=50452 RepID=A0A087FWY9_ARAAL|nr:hypothetical protein AALP_AAs63207U000100 [Arabis alpina]
MQSRVRKEADNNLEEKSFPEEIQLSSPRRVFGTTSLRRRRSALPLSIH